VSTQTDPLPSLKQREDCPHFDNGRCARNKYGGKPSIYHCTQCLNEITIGGKILPPPPAFPRGLGTLTRRGIDITSFGLARPIAEAIAKILTAKNCGCNGREACLDKLVPDVRAVGALGWLALAPRILACAGT